MTDRQNDATTTLKNLARTRADYLRGGSTNFEQSFGPQIQVALRASGTTEEGWQALCTQATEIEAEEWTLKLIQADEATAARAQENKRNW